MRSSSLYTQLKKRPEVVHHTTRVMMLADVETYRGYDIGYTFGINSWYKAAWKKLGETFWREGHILVDTIEEVPQLARECIDYYIDLEMYEAAVGHKLSMDELLEWNKSRKLRDTPMPSDAPEPEFIQMMMQLVGECGTIVSLDGDTGEVQIDIAGKMVRLLIPDVKPPKQVTEERRETVNHPPHYNVGKIEVIDAIEDWQMGFHDGNVVKYVSRWRHKGGVEDLKKALWYLQRLIELESGEPKEDMG